MLELRDITKKYNNVAVVKSVSFQAQRGEIIGYLGPNGAGKSTTVKMLAGLLEPTSGHIFLDGADIKEDITGYKAKMGYLPEQSELYPHLSGKEHLQLVGRLRHIPEKLLDFKIEGLMNAMGIGVNMYLPISNYSKGMRQKVLIAASMLHDPEILLLDEPLSGLDVTAAMVLKDILTEFVRAGKIIIYSSHVLEVVEKLCHRVIIIDGGKILVNDSVSQLRHFMHLPSLESIFRQLVQQEDTSLTAEKIMSIIRTGTGDNHVAF